MRTITAREGYVYRRLHDGFEMGKTIHLGIDHSTGEPREDKEEYYEEVVDNRGNERLQFWSILKNRQ